MTCFGCLPWRSRKKNVHGHDILCEIVSPVEKAQASIIQPTSDPSSAILNASGVINDPDTFQECKDPLHPREETLFHDAALNKEKDGQQCSIGTLTGWQILAAGVLENDGGGGCALSCSSVEEQRPADAAHEAQTLSTLPVATASSSPVASKDAGNKILECEYELLEELGRGGFGRVLRARRRSDGVICCVKLVDLKPLGVNERQMALSEAKVVSTLHHPHIVDYQGSFLSGNQHAIVMEFCTGGDLERALKVRAPVPLSEDEAMLSFVQVCLAVQHVHSKGILHRDIKASNVLISSSGALKLGDFGISKVLAADQSCARTFVGTPFYLSPELIQDRPYSHKSDVWAAGCLLYELCSLKKPFQGQSVSAVCVKILRGIVPPLNPKYSPTLHALVGMLLTRDPRQRPSMNDVINLPYVQHYVTWLEGHAPLPPLVPIPPLPQQQPQAQLQLQRQHSHFKLFPDVQALTITPQGGPRLEQDQPVAMLAATLAAEASACPPSLVGNKSSGAIAEHGRPVSPKSMLSLINSAVTTENSACGDNGPSSARRATDGDCVDELIRIELLEDSQEDLEEEGLPAFAS